MNRIVLRSILSTLAAIVALFVGLVLVLSVLFPSTMMGLTYDLGMDDAAIFYARRSYKMSGEVHYIAFATETAIGKDDYAKIHSCGELLLAEEDGFEEYCVRRDEEISRADGTYRNYIYVYLTLAEYEVDGMDDAMALAVEGNNGLDSFKESNAIVVLTVHAMQKNDTALVSGVQAILNSINPTNQAEIDYLSNFKAFTESYLNSVVS